VSLKILFDVHVPQEFASSSHFHHPTVQSHGSLPAQPPPPVIQDLRSDHFRQCVHTHLYRKGHSLPPQPPSQPPQPPTQLNIPYECIVAYNQGTSILLRLLFDPSQSDRYTIEHKSLRDLQGLPCCIELSIRVWTTRIRHWSSLLRAIRLAGEELTFPHFTLAHPLGLETRAIGLACVIIAGASQLSFSTSTIATALGHHGASPLHLTISPWHRRHIDYVPPFAVF
jgi:hypothetical protein